MEWRRGSRCGGSGGICSGRIDAEDGETAWNVGIGISCLARGGKTNDWPSRIDRPASTFPGLTRGETGCNVFSKLMIESLCLRRIHSRKTMPIIASNPITPPKIEPTRIGVDKEPDPALDEEPVAVLVEKAAGVLVGDPTVEKTVIASRSIKGAADVCESPENVSVCSPDPRSLP